MEPSPKYLDLPLQQHNSNVSSNQVPSELQWLQAISPTASSQAASNPFPVTSQKGEQQWFEYRPPAVHIDYDLSKMQSLP